MSSWAHIQLLAEQVGGGDRAAWPELMRQLEPRLQVLVRYQPIGRLRSREDDLRNVVVAVFEKLARRDHELLARYAAMPGRPSLEAWLRHVVRSVAIDYLRGHAEYRRGEPTASGSRWVSLHTLSSGGAPAVDDSGATRRREVLAALDGAIAACAGAEVDEAATRLGVAVIHARRVVERGPRLRAVVERLFAGHRHDAIAAELGLSRREVELAIKHVEELLVALWHQGDRP